MERPWVSQYDPGVRPALDYPNISLPQLLDETAERSRDHVATIFHGATIRYGSLKRQVDRFAAGLLESGVRPGDRVAVMLPNIPQFVVAFYGVLRMGAIVVPTNPLYTVHELEHQLRDAGTTAIVTLDQCFGVVQKVLPNIHIQTVVVAGIGSVLPHHLRPLFVLKQWREGVHSVRRGGVVRRFEDLLTSRPLAEPHVADPDELAVLQYTGGTTGTSKGAMLSHRNLIANALQAHEWHWAIFGGHDIEDLKILCVIPFFHVYGLTVGMNLAIASGATMLLIPRFNAAEIMHVAEKYRPQFFPGVPTMYFALANQRDASLQQFGSIQVCISGAAPLVPEIQERFQAVSGARLVEGYGLTEASPVTHCNPVLGDGRPGTVGIPFPDTDAMITDPMSWEPLPPGTVGELTVRGPQVMKEYWNRPDETAVVLRDGWLHTGDMGVLEEDGFFRIVDRKKDTIIASGYNVYPREIEEVLLGHPAVGEAAVVGIPDEYRGETVKAVIVFKPGEHATAEDITAFCRRELAPFKVPKIVEFREDLPRTLVGKVLRRALRDEVPSAVAGQQTV